MNRLSPFTHSFSKNITYAYLIIIHELFSILRERDIKVLSNWSKKAVKTVSEINLLKKKYLYNWNWRANSNFKSRAF